MLDHRPIDIIVIVFICVMQAWLGLTCVDAAALWSLFVAFGASIIQVHNSI